MDMGLKNRRVLVSGASRGIGLAIVERFLAEGASVAFFARGQRGVDDVLTALNGKGQVYGAVVDAAEHDALRAWVIHAAETLGGIDIVVNNASASASVDWTEVAWRNSF